MKQRLDARLEVETPEHVVVSMPLAGVGSRMAAYGLDLIVRLALSLLLAVPAIFVAVNFPGLGGYAFLVMLGGLFLLHFAYYVFFETVRHGQTPGKRRLGLRTVKVNGAPVDFIASVLRNVLRLVDWMPGFYGLGVAAMFLSSSEQRLGDIAAGTVVVRERRDADEDEGTWLDPVALQRVCGQLGILEPERIEPNLMAEESEIILRLLGRRPLIDPEKAAALEDRLIKRLRDRVVDPQAVLQDHYDDPSSRSAVLEFLLRRHLLRQGPSTGGPLAT